MKGAGKDEFESLGERKRGVYSVQVYQPMVEDHCVVVSGASR